MKNKLNSQRRLTDKKIRASDILCYIGIILFAAATLGLVVALLAYIFFKGLPMIHLSFLFAAPNPIKNTIGIFPSLINTVYVILMTLLFAVPIGVGGAIYLNEYAKNSLLSRMIIFTTETLSGIPSIIFGVFGYIFFCSFLHLKVSLLSGALTLTIMVLPTMIRTTQEALKSVPAAYREGAWGMGASKWHMIRTILLPTAIPGIITSIVLSTGRVVGESAALLLVAGGSAMYMPKGSLLSQVLGSGSTLSVELFRYAYSRGETDVGLGIAAILISIVIILNAMIKIISLRLQKARQK